MQQDNDLDLVIANTVLQNLREGKTEEEAFIELENTTGHTRESVSGYWTQFLSKQYKKAVEMAKSMGRLKKNGVYSSNPKSIESHTSTATLESSSQTEDKKARSDSWTKEQDELLAKTVIAHIRNGSTQTKAFEEVGDRVDRTTAAVAFRWNSEVRKNYEKEIEEAKRVKLAAKKEFERTQADVSLSTTKTKEETSRNIPSDNTASNEEIVLNKNFTDTHTSIEEVIAFLLRLGNQLNQQNQQSPSLQSDYEQLLAKHQRLEQKYNLLKEDYELMSNIIEKARQFSTKPQKMA